MNIEFDYFTTSFTTFKIATYNNKVCMVDFKSRKKRTTIDNRIQKALNSSFVLQNNDLIEQTKKELTQYFDGTRQSFDLPLLLVGTAFQKKVWKALQTIPYGKTASYASLSEQIGQPSAVRAVANANGANAIAIIIPCHRIIGSNQQLTGYAGGLDIKHRLLKLENPLF